MIKQTFYELPEQDRERLNATEMRSARWMIAALSVCVESQRELKDRLECIPSGKARFRLMLGHLRALCNDLLGTTPYKQRRVIGNTMLDMELRMIPKHTPGDKSVVMNTDDLSFVIKYAKEALCMTCVLTGEECRQCELYKIMESICPQDDWGDSTICPYNRDDWMER